jgi:hypothetical protein
LAHESDFCVYGISTDGHLHVSQQRLVVRLDPVIDKRHTRFVLYVSGTVCPISERTGAVLRENHVPIKWKADFSFCVKQVVYCWLWMARSELGMNRDVAKHIGAMVLDSRWDVEWARAFRIMWNEAKKESHNKRKR